VFDGIPELEVGFVSFSSGSVLQILVRRLGRLEVERASNSKTSTSNLILSNSKTTSPGSHQKPKTSAGHLLYLNPCPHCPPKLLTCNPGRTSKTRPGTTSQVGRSRHKGSAANHVLALADGVYPAHGFIVSGARSNASVPSSIGYQSVVPSIQRV
jgi:hypothetical protein